MRTESGVMGKGPPKPTVTNIQFAGKLGQADLRGHGLSHPSHGRVDDLEVPVVPGKFGLLGGIEVGEDAQRDSGCNLLQGRVVAVGHADQFLEPS